MASLQAPTSTGSKLSAEQVLYALRTSTPVALEALPTTHGIYGLVDHEGEIRYIGVTASPAVGFRNRIFSRHVAGSEGYSHKFSHAYNSGRLWQDRSGSSGAPTSDGKIAKRLRAQFCRSYCRAVFYEIAADEVAGSYFAGLTALESQVQALAPESMRLWEGKNFKEMEEPKELVDELLDNTGASAETRSALLRQSSRYSDKASASRSTSSKRSGLVDGAATAREGETAEIPVASDIGVLERAGMPETLRHGSDVNRQSQDLSWFVMRPQSAQAYGRPVADGFLVQRGSTAMIDGSPRVKRNVHVRDRLVRLGVLARHVDPSLFVFTCDHIFGSSSEAGGIIKDGNCSGPSSWINVQTGKSLRNPL